MTGTEAKMNAGRGAVLLFLAWCEGCVYKVEVDSGSSAGETAGGEEQSVICYSSELGVCIEFVDEEGIAEWCAAMEESSYDYSQGSCPRGEFGTCENVTADDFAGQTPTLYFYSEFPGDPLSTCERAGGDFSR